MELRDKAVIGIGDFSKKMENIPGLLDAYEKKTGMGFYPGAFILRTEKNDKGIGTHSKKIIVVACYARLRDYFNLKDNDRAEAELVGK